MLDFVSCLEIEMVFFGTKFKYLLTKILVGRELLILLSSNLSKIKQLFRLTLFKKLSEDPLF